MSSMGTFVRYFRRESLSCKASNILSVCGIEAIHPSWQGRRSILLINGAGQCDLNNLLLQLSNAKRQKKQKPILKHLFHSSQQEELISLDSIISRLLMLNCMSTNVNEESFIGELRKTRLEKLTLEDTMDWTMRITW